jgi:hypothetical protein
MSPGMTNTRLNDIVTRNRSYLVRDVLWAAALAVTYITSAIYLPL